MMAGTALSWNVRGFDDDVIRPLHAVIAPGFDARRRGRAKAMRRTALRVNHAALCLKVRPGTFKTSVDFRDQFIGEIEDTRTQRRVLVRVRGIRVETGNGALNAQPVT
jgi:hypothetical protein